MGLLFILWSLHLSGDFRQLPLWSLAAWRAPGTSPGGCRRRPVGLMSSGGWRDSC